jgi:hypothetical protein
MTNPPLATWTDTANARLDAGARRDRKGRPGGRGPAPMTDRQTPDGSDEGFDMIARNIAEAIDGILTTERERRLELIRRQVRHALSLGYRARRP